MEAGNILSADVLDIIFDARNKEYGAYDLRKNYQRRLVKALLTTVLIVVLLLIAYLLAAAIKPKTNKPIEGCTLVLENVLENQKLETPVTPPPVKQEIIEVKTKQFTKFLIAPDDQVRDEDKPTKQTDLDDAKIGVINVDGKPDDGITGPPVEAQKGIVDAPKKQDNSDDRFIPIEKESEYPGGVSAWGAFLNRNLIYPQDAIDNQVQGTVTVQFIVDGEGTVSNITAISGPEELRPSAIAVIKKSGAWTPALQNGRHVKSYKKQPITFKLVE